MAHDEQQGGPRWIKCPITHQLIPFRDCLTCAATYQGQIHPATGQRTMCNFRYPQLLAMMQSSLRRKGVGISSTMLTGCLRAKWFDVNRFYAIDPQKAMASLNGTAWHEYMEQHNQPAEELKNILPCEIGVSGEERLVHQLPSGRIITGQFDRLIQVPPEHRTIEDPEITEWWIEDYKRKEDDKIFRVAPEYYVLQLNIYALMIHRGCSNSTNGEIYHPGKHRVTKLTLLPSSHKEQGTVVNVHFLPEEALIAYLEECLDLWQAGTTASPPPRHTQPEDDFFCRTWCVHYDACIRAGGEPYDPKIVLFEQAALLEKEEQPVAAAPVATKGRKKTP